MGDRRPAIAVVSDAIYPYNKGGKEMRYHQLIEGLPAAGFDVDVYTMKWWEGPAPCHGDRIRFHSICGRRSLYTGSRRSIVQALVFSAACLRLLLCRFDVIEADHMPYLQLFPLRLVAWAKRVPLVVTWHEVWGGEYWREYLGVAGIIAAAVERLSTRVPDHIVAASDETGRRLIALGVPAGRLTIVRNGIDVDLIAATGADATAPDVLFVGRLMAHKNVNLLIDAVAQLRDDGRRTTCAVVGEGPERLRLEALVAAHGLEGEVTFLGALESATAVYGLMKGTRVFALPSIREGFGITVLEAMACGALVVTVDHPDNQARTLVRDGIDGRLCLPVADALAAALLDTLDGPTLRRRAAVDAPSAASWNWVGIVAELAANYSSVLAAHR